MSDQAQPKARGGWLKAAVVGMLGLGGGAAGTYSTALIDRVAKPTLPVANFAVTADGLSLTCQNRASGDSGWWDFGDGTALEPFDPGQTELKHTYAKPGTYTVKLTVRNFVADENDRSVPVDLTAVPWGVPKIPAVLDFAVRPVSAGAVAPATFRITGEVRDAEACVWDYGDGRQEVTEAGGPIDRMVTFDKPGAYTVQVFAHNGKQAIKLASPVHVAAPRSGSLSLTLRITDTGTRIDQTTRAESVALQVPKEAKGGFSRTLTAHPGWTIAAAAPASPNTPGVKNLKVEVAADGRTIALSGDWDGGAKGLNKAAGGSDVIIPLKLTEKRVTAIKPVVNTITGSPSLLVTPAMELLSPGVEPAGYPPTTVAAPSAFELPLPAPPAGLTQHSRQFQVELRQTGRSQPLFQAPALTLPWSAVFAATDGRKWVCSITPDGAKAVVSINPLAQ
jgi:hypothetical protein